MNLNSGMTIRFPAALRERLDSVAANSGLKPSDLIRMAVELYVEKARTTGRIEIPLILNDAPSTTPREVRAAQDWPGQA